MATCRYADLAARVAASTPPIACEIPATLQVLIRQCAPGIAFWVIAEVCVMCVHMARDLPGFDGEPWPIPVLTAP